MRRRARHPCSAVVPEGQDFVNRGHLPPDKPHYHTAPEGVYMMKPPQERRSCETGINQLNPGEEILYLIQKSSKIFA